MGRKTASGVRVNGTEDAMSKEFTDVLIAIQGDLGNQLRANILKMKEEIREDQEVGASHQALRQLVSL